MQKIRRTAVVFRAARGVCLISGGLLAFTARARANVSIVPTFDSSITGDPNAATIESTINTAISNIENDLANPVTVNITFGEMSSGLGQSQTYLAETPYTTYLSTLQDNQTDSADDTHALATLPSGSTNPVNGNANIIATLPLLRALGFGASPPAGQPDSTILFNAGIVNDSRPGSNPSNYDLESVVAHEMDEVLGSGGAGSQLNAVLSNTSDGSVGPLDLFRYSASGTRSFSTSTSVSSYFSIDGGNTNFVNFNQINNGADYGDWGDGVVPADGRPNNPPQVQDAFGAPGITPLLEPNIGPNELAALDVIGWNLTSAGLALEATLPIGLTWNDASSNNSWDNAASSNWNNGSATTVFHSDDNITFSDINGSAAGRYSVTLNNTVFPGSVTVNNSNANYVIAGSGCIAGTGSLSKLGNGTLTLDTVNLYGGATNVSAGVLVAGVSGALPGGAVNISGGTLRLGSSTGAAEISSLSISGAGVFDVNNNHLIINYSGSSDPIASIAALLATGYNGGSWNGAGGIGTSAPLVVGGLTYGLGYADAADPQDTATGLAAGTIEIKYTLLGDADLNGIVNGIDFGILAANFNKGITGWDEGDFDYNNIVNGLDFGDLAANFNKGAAGTDAVAALDAFAAANGLLADVPEPASGAIFVAAGLGILRRRRRELALKTQ